VPSRATAPPTDAPDQADARFGARAVLAGLAILLAAVPFSLLLFLVQDRWRPLLHVDDGARDSLHGFAVHHQAFVTVMRTLSTIGSAPVYLVVFAVIAAWLAWRRLPRLAAFVVVTMLGSSALNTLVKLAVDRARPVVPDPVAHANGMSFPSGHAQSAMVAFSVLLLVFLPVLRGAWRWVAVAVAGAMVLGIGFSRVALGVHYVSDVLAGYVLGAAWVAAMTAAFSAWRRERGHGGVDPTEGLEPAHRDRLTPGPGRDAPASRSG
jgi:membrane-associated phospholipid phosphatase